MKSREVACIYYDHEGSCLKGRDGIFWKTCQKCQLYKPIRGGKPARPNLRNKKREDARERETRKAINEC